MHHIPRELLLQIGITCGHKEFSSTVWIAVFRYINVKMLYIQLVCYVVAEREKILDAMRHWEENTCTRFHPVAISSKYQCFLHGVFFTREEGMLAIYFLILAIPLVHMPLVVVLHDQTSWWLTILQVIMPCTKKRSDHVWLIVLSHHLPVKYSPWTMNWS